jgi:hypothetical protein
MTANGYYANQVAKITSNRWCKDVLQMTTHLITFEVLTGAGTQNTVFWDLILCSLVYRYTSVSRFVNFNVMNFDLQYSTILIRMCQPSVAGSDKLQYDHAVRKLASTILLLSCRSLSAQSSSVFHQVKETACMLNTCGSKYCFVLSSKVFAFYAFCSYYVFLLQALCSNFWNQMPYIFHIENLFLYQWWFYGFIGSKPSQKLKHHCGIILQMPAAVAADGDESKRSF